MSSKSVVKLDRVSKETIREWLEEGMQKGATHVIIVCDPHDDYDDYHPVMVMLGEEPRFIYNEYNEYDAMFPGRHVVAVYALHIDLNKQLSNGCNFNYEKPFSSTELLNIKRDICNTLNKLDDVSSSIIKGWLKDILNF